ncbi:hypothetical protein [Neobacillus notoginsengisoli]|uniref:hypothetical protein n=1 Tax=Neobacillus notoginsengisoli TaxID=1578198 RepID=UPI001314133C|nr:hypothetical protein [Neobacillus notoginsengisoli]
MLNIEMMLKGMPKTEKRIISQAYILMIELKVSFKVISEVIIEIGITIIVANAI